MNEIVKINEKGWSVTTSFNVAEIFEKRHSDVLRDIRNLHCSPEFSELNFAFSLISRGMPQGGVKEEPYCEMTKDGFSFLVLGYTGEKAAAFKEKFINAFRRYELLLQGDDYIMNRASEISKQRLLKLEAQLFVKDKQIELAESTIKENAPKIEYHDKVLMSETKITATLIAKDLGMSAIALDRLLHSAKIIFQQGKTWVLYSQHQNKGYTKSMTVTYVDKQGNTQTTMHTYWTEEGRKFVMENVARIKGEKGPNFLNFV